MEYSSKILDQVHRQIDSLSRQIIPNLDCNLHFSFQKNRMCTKKQNSVSCTQQINHWKYLNCSWNLVWITAKVNVSLPWNRFQLSFPRPSRDLLLLPQFITEKNSAKFWQKFSNISDTFKRDIVILVNWHISTRVFWRELSSRQNTRVEMCRIIQGSQCLA